MDDLTPHEWLMRGIAADDRQRRAQAAAAGDPAAMRAETAAAVDELFTPEPPPPTFDHGVRPSAPGPEPEPGLDRIRKALEGGTQ